MRVPVGSFVWAGYRRAVGWRIRDQAVARLSPRTFSEGLRSPVVDALGGASDIAELVRSPHLLPRPLTLVFPLHALLSLE